jgi:bifunctional DNase/RNase
MRTRAGSASQAFVTWRFLLVAALLIGCGGAPPPATPTPKPVEVPKAGDDEPAGEDDEAAAPIAPKAPAGYIEMTVAGVRGTESGNAVILVDAARRVAVPVFVGGTEALSIQLRLDGKKYERPLTHDLLDAMLARFDARVVAVRVDSIENDVFIGAVLVQRGKRVEEFDSRVSDALALALGSKVPIYVAQRVVDKSGIDVRQLGMEPGETARRAKGRNESEES